ncbi:ATP-binding Cassette (ABC) Superfamily [Trachipleistophora hominis]|uniref:ATP-binding Cassette (ABC) Superfamily n=1 Tax=Trachipleistophora hominis TaxID=72359 RepID=L7JS40_TRAHO|nr:ATP-binding Cassette (ABC) Superfamily [Trachipleistophora hominis]
MQGSNNAYRNSSYVYDRLCDIACTYTDTIKKLCERSPHMSKPFQIFIFVVKEMFSPPLKPCFVIFTIVAIIFITELLLYKIRIENLRSLSSCKNYSTLRSFLFYTTICGIIYPTKFLVYQVIYSDYLERLSCRAFYTVLSRRWEITLQEEGLNSRFKNLGWLVESVTDNGIFQSFVHRGVKGMTNLIRQLVLSLLARIFSYFFVMKETNDQLGTTILLAIIFMIVITLLTNIIIIYILIYYRRRYNFLRAQLDNHVSECLSNHLLVTYCHKEMDEYQRYKMKVKNYRTAVVMLESVEHVLEILLYLITNITKFVVYYVIYKNNDVYPVHLVMFVMQKIDVIEQNTKWAGSFYEKLRKAILDAEFAYDFVSSSKNLKASHDSDLIIAGIGQSRDTCTDHGLSDSHSDEGEQPAAKRYLETTVTLPSKEIYYDENENVTNTAPSRNTKGTLIMQFRDFTIIMNQKLLFKPLNLSICKNDKILIKGPNGIGKSSIIRAIFGMIDYIGDVTIKGVPLQNINTSKLCAMMAICPQSPLVFKNTIRFNLGYGNCATDEGMTKMCKHMNLFDKLVEMEDGLDSLILSGGENFSGGEKKRLCVARAALKRCEIYWFDEPTAGLDSTNMHAVVDFITRMKGTVIAIMHTDEYDRCFDQVIYLERM